MVVCMCLVGMTCCMCDVNVCVLRLIAYRHVGKQTLEFTMCKLEQENK